MAKKKKKKEKSKSLAPNSVAQINPDLPKPIQRIINRIPDPKDRNYAIKEAEVLIYKSHKGILPSPEDLAKYDKIIPNGANRLTTMAEDQSRHRIEIENKVINSQINQSKTGQIMAFFLTIVILGTICLLALTGHDTVAGVLGGSTIVSLAYVFISGKKAQRKDLEKKNN